MPARKALVLDLETVPDLAVGQVLLGERDDLRAELGRLHGQRDAPEPEKAFLKLPLHRIVAIGTLLATAEENPVPHWQVNKIGAVFVRETDEAAFLARLENRFADDKPLLVGFNTRGFDLPVLRYRALKLGVPMPTLFGSDPTHNYLYRFAPHVHSDLCDVLIDHGASSRASLREVAALLGLPLKDGFSGAAVEEAINAGHQDEIVAYCACDVAATWLIQLRLWLIQGKISKDGWIASMQSFIQKMEEEPILASSKIIAFCKALV